MAVGNVSQIIAAEHEFLDPKLELLILSSAPFIKEIENRPTDAVSTRPIRLAYQTSSAGNFSTTSLDGANLGRGAAPNTVFGNISCVPFVQASEYTALSMYSSDSDEKAIKSYVAAVQQGAAESFGQYRDALAVYGDGANTIDTVTGTVTGGITVNNANKFQANQQVDVWSSVTGTGTFRGTTTVLTVDVLNSTIWTVGGSIPAGTTSGDYLLVHGSQGLSGTGYLGLFYYQTTGNAGNYQGIQRSSYPGLFSTPNINLNSGALTPASVRAMEASIRLSIGIEKANTGGLVGHCGVDIEAAWENNALLVQHIVMNEVKGDESVDMLKPKAPTKIAGRRLIVNERATPGRLDFVALKNWGRYETKKFGFYECGGQTVFPIYGTDGGVASSMIFYYICMDQLSNGQPRSGGYISNIKVPRYYFGN